MTNTIDLRIRWVDKDQALATNYLGERVRTLAGLVVGIGRPKQARFSANPEPDLFGPLWEQLTQGGLVDYSFAAFGAPGQEKVYAFTRREGFPEPSQPTVDAVLANAVAKYGVPHDQESGIGAVEYRWSYAGSDDPNAKAPRCDAPIYWTQHYKLLRPYRDDAGRGCGVAIRLRVSRAPNGIGAHSMDLGIRNSTLFAQEEERNVRAIEAAAMWKAGSRPAPRF